MKRLRSSFLSDLTANGQAAALTALQSTALHTDLSPLLERIYRTAGLFGARLTDKELTAGLSLADRAQIARHRSGKKAASLGQNEQWVSDVIDFLRLHLVKFVSAITETMRRDIVKILEQAAEEGWTLETMVKELKRLDLMEARAKVIARTETIRAANVGHSVAAQSTPYEVDKKWNSAKDHRTRESHRSINGHTIDEDGLFDVAWYKGKVKMGVDQMLYPGDATAHAANTINCRCRVTYLPKRNADGRLIMRPANAARIIPLRNPSTSIPAHQIAAALKANIRIGVNPPDATE